MIKGFSVGNILGIGSELKGNELDGVPGCHSLVRGGMGWTIGGANNYLFNFSID